MAGPIRCDRGHPNRPCGPSCALFLGGRVLVGKKMVLNIYGSRPVPGLLFTGPWSVRMKSRMSRDRSTGRSQMVNCRYQYPLPPSRRRIPCDPGPARHVNVLREAMKAEEPALALDSVIARLRIVHFRSRARMSTYAASTSWARAAESTSRPGRSFTWRPRLPVPSNKRAGSGSNAPKKKPTLT